MEKNNLFAESNASEANFKLPQQYVLGRRDTSGQFLGILEDAKGNIWFGCGCGVYRYDGKAFTDFKSKESQK